jgi:hypothetical protein
MTCKIYELRFYHKMFFNLNYLVINAKDFFYDSNCTKYILNRFSEMLILISFSFTIFLLKLVSKNYYAG